MIKWFLQVIVGWPWCKHQWEIYREVNIFQSPSDKMPVAAKYHLQCKKCGDMTVRRL